MKGGNLSNYGPLSLHAVSSGGLYVYFPPELVQQLGLTVDSVVYFDSQWTVDSPQLDLQGLPSPVRPLPKQIAAVHEYSNQVMGLKRKLTQKRLAIVKARLAEGFTVAQLQQVAKWVSGNAFLRGSNERHRAYDDYANMYRSAERIEEYLRYANSDAPTDLMPADLEL